MTNKFPCTAASRWQIPAFSSSHQTGNSLGRDYLLYSTGAQTFIPRLAPLMFVGYGIAAPEFAYNDYQALNVEGKIVVFLSGEPASADPSYFDGALPTLHSLPEIKQKIALARGAAGSIMIPVPQSQLGGDWRYWQQEFAFEDISLPYFVAGNLRVVMNPHAAQRLFNCECGWSRDV